MKPIFLLVVLSALAVIFPLEALADSAGGKVLVERGKITSLALDSGTIVVEVPLKGRLYTVGGKLTPTATVVKNGLKADLYDLRVGDGVKVGWVKTKTGHSITLLDAGTQLAAPSTVPKRPDPAAKTVIGKAQHHVIKKRETLLDIARQYGLGFNEIQDLYPQLDPWVSPEGMELIIPSLWVLPDVEIDGIVINVPELRLYYYSREHGLVQTYPLGLGEGGWATPLGFFRIGKKTINPTWYIPASLQSKYAVRSIPPGPDNPLGGFWMSLGNSSYGIHGTDIPWSVGRLVTHGCIRMYPEHMRVFYYMVKPGTPVRIIYEPVKIGLDEERVFVEVHRDIYNRIEDFNAYGYQRLRGKNMVRRVDLDKFRKALVDQDGLPTDISR